MTMITKNNIPFLMLYLTLYQWWSIGLLPCLEPLVDPLNPQNKGPWHGCDQNFWKNKLFFFSCWWNVRGTWWIPLIFTNSVPNILGWLYLSFNNIGSFLRIELSRGSFINSNWAIYVCLLFSPLGRNFQCNFSELWTISIHCKWILCPLGGDKVFPGWKPEQMNGEQRRNTTRSEWAREVR